MMRSLKLEQVAVIKFLTLEGSDSQEIFNRIKNVFGDFTLPKSKISKLHSRFLNEGLLGIKDEPLYEDESSLLVSNRGVNCEEDNLQIEIDTSQIESPVKEETNITFPNSKKISKIESSIRVGSEKFKINDDSPCEEFSPPVKMKRKASIKATNTWRSAFKTIKVESSDPRKSQNSFKVQLESCELPKEEDSENENNIVSDYSNFNLPFFPLMDLYESQTLLDSLHSNLSCLLCIGKNFQHRSRLKAHLIVHLKHSVSVANIRSLLCKMSCEKSGRGHYHCPLCPHVSSHTNRIRSHFKIHIKRRNENYPETVNDETLATYMPNGQTRDRCTCVDPNEGVYLVQKTNFGSLEPVHVLKRIGELITDENVVVSQCSEELCEMAMRTAKHNGNSDLECKHLRKVHFDADFQPQSFSLEENCLDGLLISDHEKERCISLAQLAIQKGASLIVEWVADDTTIYFSVFSDAPYATMGRILVTYSTTEDHFLCKCPLPEKSHFCAYKVIAEAYYKNEKLKNINERNKIN